jgi:hypothetical protein
MKSGGVWHESKTATDFAVAAELNSSLQLTYQGANALVKAAFILARSDAVDSP